MTSAEKDRQAVLQYVQEKARKPVTAAELADACGISASQMSKFLDMLQAMERQGLLVKTRAGRYGIPARMNLAVGTVQGNPRGFAFLIPDDEEQEDLFLSPVHTGGAMHGDRVVARIHSCPRAGEKGEAEVIRILERANRRLVGTFECEQGANYVVPDESRIWHDILIPKSKSAGAKHKEKVVAELTRWPQMRRGPEGKVVERIGCFGEPGVDVAVVIKKYGLAEKFPSRVLAAVAGVPDTAVADNDRKDLRELLTVTIDGADARDFDDAISVARLPEGWRLWVHIADVSHYVPEGSAIDQEAARRGTSVYLVDRVLPMLPERLSNGICSLQPGEDRLAFSVRMDFTAAGERREYEFCRSVIRSDARLTCQQVTHLLEGKQTDLEKQVILPMLREAAGLAEALHSHRLQSGAVEFDFSEEKVELDQDGRPVRIYPAVRTIADQIIEEMMIICNQTVAEHIFWAKVPSLYRVHEEPSGSDWEDLRSFLAHFGYRLSGVRRIHPRHIQAVLNWARGRREEELVNTVVLRTMQKARYAPECIGHFGLATRFYTHFTAPIRRYPDLIVHRILSELVKQGTMSKQRISFWESRLPAIALTCSEAELTASMAERESVEIKKVQYMKERLGEVFTGLIAMVVPFGFFVRLENTVEGLVHVSSLHDDYYHFQEARLALVGERTGRQFQNGEAVRVQVTRASLEDRQIDFILV